MAERKWPLSGWLATAGHDACAARHTSVTYLYRHCGLTGIKDCWRQVYTFGLLPVCVTQYRCGDPPRLGAHHRAQERQD